MALSKQAQTDPAIEAFLNFLAEDIDRSPKQLKPLDPALAARIDALAGHLAVNPHDDLGDESLV